MTTDVPSGRGWATGIRVDGQTFVDVDDLNSAVLDKVAEIKAREDARIDEALDRARAIRRGEEYPASCVRDRQADQAAYNDLMGRRAEIMEGRKDDAGKPPLHLIPPEYLYAVAEILDYGQKKYSPRNWEKGMDWSRCYRAALGHLFDWFSFKGPDLETGKSHLWHAAASVMFLVVYEIRRAGNDDRPAHGVGPRPGRGTDETPPAQ